MKHTSSSISPRLRRVVDQIEGAGTIGITTWSLQLLARCTCVGDAIYELRLLGVPIVAEWETSGGKTYRRYWRAHFRTLNPVSGGRAELLEGEGL